jgi:hypothetical protein
MTMRWSTRIGSRGRLLSLGAPLVAAMALWQEPQAASRRPDRASARPNVLFIAVTT